MPDIDPILSPYEGQTVSSVVLAGQPNLDPREFEAVITQKSNEPFSQQKVQQSARALKQKGHFDQVRINVQPDVHGVMVYFILEPAFSYGIFAFPGAQQFSYSQLIQKSNYPPQMPYSAEEVENDRASLQAFFQQQGYFRAQVESKLRVDMDHRIVSVDFQVELGKKAKFGSLVIRGAPDNEGRYLHKKLTDLLARLRGASIRPGKTYHRSNIDKAVRYLQSILVDKGYLGARVKLEGAEYHTNNNRADIHFSIQPGPVTRVKISGAHLGKRTRRSILPVYQGVGVNEEIVHEGQQVLTSYFQSKGYFDVNVSSKLDASQTEVTVIYRIIKNKKRKVASVDITGNTHLSDSRLMPGVSVDSKHFLSSGKFSAERVRKSVEALTAYYKAEGFNKVKVTPSVIGHGKDISVKFTVMEGPQDIVRDVRIEGANTLPKSQFAPHGLRMRSGQPYSAAHMQEDRNTIIANYLRAGYLNATSRETASQVSKQDPHHIDVVYHIDEGPRVITKDVIILGQAHTDQRVIQADIAPIGPGKPLTEEDLLASGAKLYGLTGVFDWADVAPKRQITTQTEEDVLVKLHEAKRNELQYGFGFEIIQRGGNVPGGTVALPNLPPVGLPANFTTSQATFWGPRGTAQYTRNNLHGRGESMTLTAFAGRLDQRFAFYYIDPSFRWSSWKATTEASYERNEQNPVFSSRVETGSMQIQRATNRAQTDVAFFRYNFTKTDLTHVLLQQLVPERDQHIHLSALSASFVRDTRDNPLDEHKGVLGSLELDFNSSALGSSADFVKLTGQAAFYKQTFHRMVWANSVRIGLAQPFNDSFVPLSEAFFTGGGNSLRGFPLDGAGPQRAVEVCPNGETGCGTFIQVPAGGREQLILNTEARIPLEELKKNLGLAIFYDGGNVFPYVGFHEFTSLYSNSVGLGLRYATPIGPIRFDIGRNLDPIRGVKATQYFISIGQAF